MSKSEVNKMTIKADGFRITIVCMYCTSTDIKISYDREDTPYIHCNKCGQEAELI